MFLSNISAAAVILNFSSSISRGRGNKHLFILHYPTERSHMECGLESGEATLSSFHVQVQLSQSKGLMAWHSGNREHSSDNEEALRLVETFTCCHDQ
jgi:hypothetical protein